MRRLFPVLQIAEAISKPLCETKKITMVSCGGSEVGAAKLTGEVLDIMTRLPAAVEKLTGVRISQVSWSVNVRRETGHAAAGGNGLVSRVLLSSTQQIVGAAGLAR